MATPVFAPITGIVWKILVGVGDSITPEQPVMILESMKMEVPIGSPCGGLVCSIEVSEGQPVEDGETVATVQEHPGQQSGRNVTGLRRDD
jgi:acetyl-CoA carboxylase biotin carboxyl carrier protein